MNKPKLLKKDNKKPQKPVKSTKQEITQEVLLNKDIYRIIIGLTTCQSFTGRKFGYMLAKNARIIQKEMDDLEKSVVNGLEKKLSDDLKEYREKVTNLKAEHKIIEGKPESEKYKTEYEQLKEKYKDCVEAFEEDHKEMLEEPANIKISQCKMQDVPEVITGGQMADIFECVEYDK